MKFAGALAAIAGAATVTAELTPARVEARATHVARASSLPTITQKGNAFYQGSDRFYIKGLDYQPGGSSEASDPLADTSVCGRDIPEFSKLGVNVVRVYTVDNTANHDECMSMLADAGIYLALDVNTPLYSINQLEPAVSYNAVYLQSVFATIDAFATYDNLLLFFSGNEVINAANNTDNAPYVKATTRDMKQYIGERGYRSIPVGYSAADVVENQYAMAQYMDCGEEPSRSDFYAINNYQWCDPSSLSESGWETTAELYANYSKPVFFSEYGCIDPGPRTFEETPALYESVMTKSISGGLVYEYTNAGNDYGLVNIKGNTVKPIGSQFSDLEAQMKKIVTPSGNGGATTGNSDQPCPAQGKYWDTKPFTGSALPATPSGAMQYFQNGAGKGPGLDGKGSQEAGTGKQSTASKSAGAVQTTYGNGSGSSSGTSSGASQIRADMMPFVGAGIALAFCALIGATVL